MSDKYPPGTQITVMVDGIDYPTYIDDNGVQRFYKNGVIDALADANLAEFDRRNAVFGWAADRPKSVPGELDLNQIALDYWRGVRAGNPPWTKRDYIEFNMMLGYSVCGLCDLSIMEDVEIINPCWETEE